MVILTALPSRRVGVTGRSGVNHLSNYLYNTHVSLFYRYLTWVAWWAMSSRSTKDCIRVVEVIGTCLSHSAPTTFTFSIISSFFWWQLQHFVYLSESLICIQEVYLYILQQYMYTFPRQTSLFAISLVKKIRAPFPGFVKTQIFHQYLLSYLFFDLYEETFLKRWMSFLDFISSITMSKVCIYIYIYICTYI